VPSIYALKPAFQRLLRPLATAIARSGGRANHVTLLACLLSIALGVLLTVKNSPRELWLILPVFLFVRMALNAIDGMLAREFGHKSDLGAYLNELTDVISDSFLYLPFAFLPIFDPLWIGAAIVLAVISEMSGVVGVMIGASRRYDGPMGKSDRAFIFGAIGLCLGLGVRLPDWLTWGIPRAMALLLALTIVNRVRSGLAEKKKPVRAASARVG
jgi:CDP-diacylglycerol--glycerol-3-phosphate 3-phosphatidyltransferase